MSSYLQAQCTRNKWKYVELRPLTHIDESEFGWEKGQSFFYHEIDLNPDLQQLFGNLHKDSIQRKIRRAEREKLFYEAGRSQLLLDEFYGLLAKTRRRHQLLPQPKIWFENLSKFMGNAMEIRLVRNKQKPIAAILTLVNRTTVVYKYGCSDEEFHGQGGMPFLFWRLIEETKSKGMEKIDLGRSSISNRGLVQFKERLGARRAMLTYHRYPSRGGELAELASHGPIFPAVRKVFSILPDGLFCLAGNIFYKHLG